ncbi:hypothetical protein FA95DRAFT_1285563 [Auriscalpium vulgare]|uniref:Uncharacterized protein n=1 Tax=Auriscalpium vulgare TaxID=40419 RepID=A0ACB8RTE6_9AGAM|nr:hypothetical protein FA95DRAFT_1285563 [Auriscalpium vulgare]
MNSNARQCPIPGSQAVQFWRDTVATRLTQLGAVPAYATILATPQTFPADEARLRKCLELSLKNQEAEEAHMQEAVDAVRTRLAQDTRAIEDAITTLCAQRNALAPVSHLPPEVLTKILALLAALAPAGGADLLQPAIPGWIAATHVCARWRAIALACPQLWTSVTFRLGAAWADAMAARAQDLPLALCTATAGFGVNVRSTERRLVERYLPRTSRFKLVLGHQANEMILPPYLRAWAPALEELEIAASFKYPSRTMLTAELFGGRTPSLRSLTVRTNARFLWTSPLLTGLTTLEIHQQDLQVEGKGLRGREMPPLRDVVGALRNLRSLTRLVLHDLAISGHATVNSSEPIVLDRLQYFKLSATLKHAIPLLKYILIAPTATVHMDLLYSGEEADVVASVFRTFVGLSARKLAVAPARRGGPRGTEDILSVQLWTLESGHAPAFSLLLRAQTPRSVWRELGILQHAVAALSSPNLGELSLSDPTLDTVGWAAALAHAPRARALEASGFAAVALCSVLAAGLTPAPAAHATSPHSDPTRRGGALLPELTSLKLCGVDFAACSQTSLGPRYFWSTTSRLGFSSQLPVWLAARARAGLPLHELVLESCAVSREVLSVIQAVVRCGVFGH